MGNVTVTASDSLAFGDVPIAGQPGALQTAPRFPLALASTKDLLSFSNAFPSDTVPTLSSDVAASDLTIAVTTGTGSQFPGDNFEVSIDDEIIFVALRSGDSLTGCRRGAENSTAASHLTGATVQLLITAVSHNQVVSEVIEIEQLLGARGQHIFPIEIALTPGAPGNFTVAHGLLTTPVFAIVQMTSGGAIWFQPGRYDQTDLFLTASDGGITGYAQVWS